MYSKRLIFHQVDACPSWLGSNASCILIQGIRRCCLLGFRCNVDVNILSIISQKKFRSSSLMERRSYLSHCDLLIICWFVPGPVNPTVYYLVVKEIPLFIYCLLECYY
ncbi:hypothetical protein Peur_013707 [Populus x canadensis]